MDQTDRLEWFPFYVADFLTDPAVDRMSATALGGYLRILLFAWRTATPGIIANDAAALREHARLTPAEWRKHGPSILRAFQASDDGTLLVQKRMVHVAAMQRAKVRQRHGAATARWNKSSADANAPISDAPQCETDVSHASRTCETDATSPSRNENKSKNKSKREKTEQTVSFETADGEVSPPGPGAPAPAGGTGEGASGEQAGFALTGEKPSTRKPRKTPKADPLRDQTASLAGYFRERWVALRQPEDGKPPRIDNAGFAQLRALVEAHGPDEARRLVDRYLADSSKFLVENGHAARFIGSRADAYRATKKPNGLSDIQRGFVPRNLESADLTHELYEP